MQDLTPSDRRNALPNAVSGALIFTFAGSLWFAYGVYCLKHKGEPWLTIFLVILALCLFGAALWLRPQVQRPASDVLSPEEKQQEAWAGKRFGIVNAVQGVAIFLAVQVWNNLHLPEYFSPTVAIIVGLHFIALAPVYRAKSHWIVGGIMCALAAVTVLAAPKYFSFQNEGIASTPVFLWGCILGFGNGLVLWANAGIRLRAVLKAVGK